MSGSLRVAPCIPLLSPEPFGDSTLLSRLSFRESIARYPRTPADSSRSPETAAVAISSFACVHPCGMAQVLLYLNVDVCGAWSALALRATITTTRECRSKSPGDLGGPLIGSRQAPVSPACAG